jgi:hypothetical protein
MLLSYALVVILMLPGMTEPKVQRVPIESFEACLAKVKEAGAAMDAHKGEQFVYAVVCEVTGSKADPA